MFRLLLQSNGPATGGGVTMIGIITLLLLVFIIYKIVSFLYRKSRTARNFTLLYSMWHNGPNSIQTIGALENVVRDMLKADGVKVDELNLVHEIGNRYQAILVSNCKQYELSITADRAGNVMYKIL